MPETEVGVRTSVPRRCSQGAPERMTEVQRSTWRRGSVTSSEQTRSGNAGILRFSYLQRRRGEWNKDAGVAKREEDVEKTRPRRASTRNGGGVDCGTEH